MLDKVFIVLFVILIFAGVFAMQVHVQESGQVPEIAKIIDIGKLRNLGEDFNSFTRISKSTYRITMEDNLNRLSQNYRQLEEQRKQLVLNRRMILDKLLALGEDIEAEAQDVIKILETEKTGLLNRFPQLNTIGDSFIQARAKEDLAERQKDYDKIEADINTFMEETVFVSQKNRQALTQLLGSLRSVLDDEPSRLIKDCPKPLEYCLPPEEEKLKEALVGLLEDIVNNPQRDEEKLVQLSQDFIKELKLLIENFEASEIRLTENDSQIESRLRDYVGKMQEVFDNDLKGLIESYRTIQEEQEVLLGNLEFSENRLRAQGMRLGEQLKTICANLLKAQAEGLSQLRERYQALALQKESLVREFSSNEAEIRLSHRQALSQTQNVLVVLVDTQQNELKKITSERKLKEKENRNKAKLQSALLSTEEMKGQLQNWRSQEDALRQSRAAERSRQDVINDQRDSDRKKFMDQPRPIAF